MREHGGRCGDEREALRSDRARQDGPGRWIDQGLRRGRHDVLWREAEHGRGLQVRHPQALAAQDGVEGAIAGAQDLRPQAVRLPYGQVVDGRKVKDGRRLCARARGRRAKGRDRAA